MVVGSAREDTIAELVEPIITEVLVFPAMAGERTAAPQIILASLALYIKSGLIVE